METNKLALRPLENADIPLLTSWLNKDYILRWYHDPADWLAEINGRHRDFAWIHHFIVTDGEASIGFCQYYDCFDTGDMEDWYSVTSPGCTFSIDYLIGDEAYLGKGCGKAVVALLTKTIRQTTNAKHIIVQPDTENLPSNHVLLANGFVYDEQNKYHCKTLK